MIEAGTFREDLHRRVHLRMQFTVNAGYTTGRSGNRSAAIPMIASMRRAAASQIPVHRIAREPQLTRGRRYIAVEPRERLRN